MADEREPFEHKTRCHECWNLAQCCTCSGLRRMIARDQAEMDANGWTGYEGLTRHLVGEGSAPVTREMLAKAYYGDQQPEAVLKWWGPLVDTGEQLQGKLTPITSTPDNIRAAINRHHGFN